LGLDLQQRGGTNGFSYSVYVTAHELGHHLLGGDHLGVVPNLALMHTNGYAWNAARGMCSWERERLGWISYNDVVTSGSTTKTLDDYFTTDDHIRVNTGTPGEFFLIENRQGLSSHDKAKDNGLFIFHVTDGDETMANIDVECADGNWDFYYDEQQEKLTRISENRHGKDELNFLGYNPQTHRFDIFCREPYYPENDAWGDSDDAFNVSYNPLFTPWSNPSNANGNNMLFSLYVSGVNGNSVAVKLDFSDASSHIPFRPINFVAAEQSGHPRLEWDENEEPDLDYYEVWKKVNTGSYALGNVPIIV